MKGLIKINLLVIAVITCGSLCAQKRASDKSFATVLAEIKQQQAAKNKMHQQMRLSTPTDNSHQAGPQTANKPELTIKQTAAAEAPNTQGSNSAPINKPVKQPAKSGKQ